MDIKAKIAELEKQSQAMFMGAGMKAMLGTLIDILKSQQEEINRLKARHG